MWKLSGAIPAHVEAFGSNSAPEGAQGGPWPPPHILVNPLGGGPILNDGCPSKFRIFSFSVIAFISFEIAKLLAFALFHWLFLLLLLFCILSQLFWFGISVGFGGSQSENLIKIN